MFKDIEDKLGLNVSITTLSRISESFINKIKRLDEISTYIHNNKVPRIEDIVLYITDKNKNLISYMVVYIHNKDIKDSKLIDRNTASIVYFMSTEKENNIINLTIDIIEYFLINIKNCNKIYASPLENYIDYFIKKDFSIENKSYFNKLISSSTIVSKTIKNIDNIGTIQNVV